MMHQPTPGPWTVEAPDDERPVIRSDDGGMVADMIEREDSRETQANAHLIAAAPDLLIALRTILNWDEVCQGAYAPILSAELRAAARAALEKARGQ